MREGDHLIWTNHDLDYEDWREDLEAEYPELSEDERYCKMLDMNNEYLNDERANLNIALSEPILVIADLGLWNGRRSGYKVIESRNISDCLYSNYDYTTWYVDKNGDFRCDDIHHDGTNHYLYRVFKETADEDDREELIDKIFFGSATMADIEKVTDRLGDEIGRVYGWDFPQKNLRVHEEVRLRIGTPLFCFRWAISMKLWARMQMRWLRRSSLRLRRETLDLMKEFRCAASRRTALRLR